MVVSNRNFLFQGSIFRCYVSLREGSVFFWGGSNNFFICQCGWIVDEDAMLTPRNSASVVSDDEHFWVPHRVLHNATHHGFIWSTFLDLKLLNISWSISKPTRNMDKFRLSQQQHIAASMNVWHKTLYAQMIEYKKDQKRLFRVPWKNQFQVVLSTPIGYPGAGTSAREWGGHGPDHSQHGPVLLTCLCIKQFARHVGLRLAIPEYHYDQVSMSHIGQCAVDIACIYTILYEICR